MGVPLLKGNDMETAKGTGVVTSAMLAPHREDAIVAFQRVLKARGIDAHRMKVATASFGDGWNAAMDAMRATGAVVLAKDPE
jgi:hypothetical protein